GPGGAPPAAPRAWWAVRLDARERWTGAPAPVVPGRRGLQGAGAVAGRDRREGASRRSRGARGESSARWKAPPVPGREVPPGGRMEEHHPEPEPPRALREADRGQTHPTAPPAFPGPGPPADEPGETRPAESGGPLRGPGAEAEPAASGARQRPGGRRTETVGVLPEPPGARLLPDLRGGERRVAPLLPGSGGGARPAEERGRAEVARSQRPGGAGPETRGPRAEGKRPGRRAGAQVHRVQPACASAPRSRRAGPELPWEGAAWAARRCQEGRTRIAWGSLAASGHRPAGRGW